MENISNARIQYLIKEQTEFGEFNDALYFSFEEWSEVKEDDIKKQIYERVTAWIDNQRTPHQEIEPTKEELMRYRNELNEQIEKLNIEISQKDFIEIGE